MYYCTHDLTKKAKQNKKKTTLDFWVEIAAVASFHSYVKINEAFGTADVNSNEVMLWFFFSLQKQEPSKTDYAFWMKRIWSDTEEMYTVFALCKDR